MTTGPETAVCAKLESRTPTTAADGTGPKIVTAPPAPRDEDPRTPTPVSITAIEALAAHSAAPALDADTLKMVVREMEMVAVFEAAKAAPQRGTAPLPKAGSAAVVKNPLTLTPFTLRISALSIATNAAGALEEWLAVTFESAREGVPHART